MLNEARLIGRLGKDPKTFTFDDGGKIVNAPVATWRSYKDKEGEWKTITHWHNVVIKGKAADYVPDVKKGDLVFISGESQNRSFEDKEGNTRYITEIVGFMKAMPKLRPDAYKDEPKNTDFSTTTPDESTITPDEEPEPEDDLPF